MKPLLSLSLVLGFLLGSFLLAGCGASSTAMPSASALSVPTRPPEQRASNSDYTLQQLRGGFWH